MVGPVITYLVNSNLAKIDQAQQDSMQAEEDVVGTDRIDSLRVPLQKLLLQEETSASQAAQLQQGPLLHHRRTEWQAKL